MAATQPVKIGMCALCGGTFDKSKTIICQGLEVCRSCAQAFEG